MNIFLPAAGALLVVIDGEVVFDSLDFFGSEGSEASDLVWSPLCISGPYVLSLYLRGAMSLSN